jgi:hypothetical protein
VLSDGVLQLEVLAHLRARVLAPQGVQAPTCSVASAWTRPYLYGVVWASCWRDSPTWSWVAWGYLCSCSSWSSFIACFAVHCSATFTHSSGFRLESEPELWPLPWLSSMLSLLLVWHKRSH